ncbi:MAG: PaaI family thioesterase [Gammaproteobacteria bacterium]|nr:PaaI family thioesterase [Gammaproteobacteria bacterium]MDH3372562.1 PaaI family thioesterase [Gammaproteobacteria bacterium]MDH3408844.1 PaaI family thioesterase [Gammaproteobacteria bacterium]MDH3553071.1 PaaI family thioesterase [Gammaproteobacteria bacterium]
MSDEIEAAPMCFACGQDNPIGLRIYFHFDGEVCTADFTPNQNHVGFQDTVHGGIIYTALDDVTANIMYQQGRKAHTARCEIRYRQPARVGEALKLKGWIETERRRLVLLKGEVRRASDDVLVADCESSFMLDQS